MLFNREKGIKNVLQLQNYQYYYKQKELDYACKNFATSKMPLLWSVGLKARG